MKALQFPAADYYYKIIMLRTLKVTGSHVMYDRGAWFLRVIISSSPALYCLPLVKKQKHDFQVCFVPLTVVTIFFFFRSMYDKTIIRFGFCDIYNNQGLGKGYKPQPSSTLIILDITKTSSNDCLLRFTFTPNLYQVTKFSL